MIQEKYLFLLLLTAILTLAKAARYNATSSFQILKNSAPSGSRLEKPCTNSSCLFLHMKRNQSDIHISNLNTSTTIGKQEFRGKSKTRKKQSDDNMRKINARRKAGRNGKKLNKRPSSTTLPGKSSQSFRRRPVLKITRNTRPSLRRRTTTPINPDYGTKYGYDGSNNLNGKYPKRPQIFEVIGIEVPRDINEFFATTSKDFFGKRKLKISSTVLEPVGKKTTLSNSKDIIQNKTRIPSQNEVEDSSEYEEGDSKSETTEDIIKIPTKKPKKGTPTESSTPKNSKTSEAPKLKKTPKSSENKKDKKTTTTTTDEDNADSDNTEESGDEEPVTKRPKKKDEKVKSSVKPKTTVGVKQKPGKDKGDENDHEQDEETDVEDDEENGDDSSESEDDEEVTKKPAKTSTKPDNNKGGSSERKTTVSTDDEAPSSKPGVNEDDEEESDPTPAKKTTKAKEQTSKPETTVVSKKDNKIPLPTTPKISDTSGPAPPPVTPKNDVPVVRPATVPAKIDNPKPSTPPENAKPDSVSKPIPPPTTHKPDDGPKPSAPPVTTKKEDTTKPPAPPTVKEEDASKPLPPTPAANKDEPTTKVPVTEKAPETSPKPPTTVKATETTQEKTEAPEPPPTKESSSAPESEEKVPEEPVVDMDEIMVVPKMTPKFSSNTKVPEEYENYDLDAVQKSVEGLSKTKPPFNIGNMFDPKFGIDGNLAPVNETSPGNGTSGGAGSVLSAASGAISEIAKDPIKGVGNLLQGGGLKDIAGSLGNLFG